MLLYRWFCIWRRRIGHANPEMLSRLFPFPPYPLHKGIIDAYGSAILTRTLHYTCSAFPAFIRIHHDRRLTLFRVGYKNIVHTNFNTCIAPYALVFIKYNSFVRSNQIRNCIYFIFHYKHLLLSVVCALHNYLSWSRNNREAFLQPSLHR